MLSRKLRIEIDISNIEENLDLPNKWQACIKTSDMPYGEKGSQGIIVGGNDPFELSNKCLRYLFSLHQKDIEETLEVEIVSPKVT